MGRSFKNIRETIIIGPECKESILPDIDFLSQTGILFGGLSKTRKEYLIERAHPYYNQMIYTYSGCGQTFNKGQNILIEPGTLFITKTSEPQHYGIKGDHWDFIWIWLKDSHEWDIIKKQDEICNAKFQNEVLWIFNRIFIEYSKVKFNSKTIIQSLCNLLLQYLMEELHHDTDLYRQEILEKIDNLIQKIYANMNYPWTVDTLCDKSELYLSKSHFAKVFIENTGMPPMKMVTKIRMETAANLLKNTTYNLENLSNKVGYSTPYAFSDAFKRWFGISPKIYRKNC